MIKLYLFVSVFFTSLSAFCQFEYTPYFSDDTIACTSLANECFTRVSKSFLLPEKVKKDYRTNYNLIRENSENYTKDLVKYTLLQDSIIYPFIISVYDKICKANPSVAGYKIFLSDWPIFNAANLGGKVIVFYTALLSRLENESQVAAVLCHEIAHGELDHLQKKIRHDLDEYYNKEFQQELRATMREKYNTNAKVSMLTLKYTFGTRFHQRSDEKSADSLGYVLLSKSPYDKAEEISLLNVLKHVDEVPSDTKINYEDFFGCKSSQYNFSTIPHYQRAGLFSVKNDSDTLIDSLRTHPDCSTRIEYIKQMMNDMGKTELNHGVNSLFKKIQWAAAMEMIQAFYSYEYYDYALLNSLTYLRMSPENNFLRNITSLTLLGLYETMKNHELSDYISNYSDENNHALNDLIYLLNNLRLSDLSSFVDCFYEKNILPLNENEYSLTNNYLFAKMHADNKTKILSEKYKSNYKNGRFTYLFKEAEESNSKKKKK